MAQLVFARTEKKYLVDETTFNTLMQALALYTEKDIHDRYTIANVYYDSPSFDLIRRSIEKPLYKEKFRVRSYGVPKSEDTVFVEIKKKFDGVVYKRRETMSCEEAVVFTEQGIPPRRTQIMEELAYCLKLHKLLPQIYLAYDRTALYGKDDPLLRITFDDNVRYRFDALDLTVGDRGVQYPLDGCRIMEIKVNGAMPLWLTQILSELRIYPCSFSKYGRIYMENYKELWERRHELF